jgi:hypothetical protein
MNELKKAYSISITINKETCTYAGNKSNILNKNSLSYCFPEHSYNQSMVHKDLNDLEYVYASKESSLNLSYNLKIKGSDIQDKLLYRYPNLTLPRSKVEILKDKYNVKIIRDRSKSDYQIISHKHIEKLLIRSWRKIYDKESVIKHVNTLKESLDVETFASLTEFLEKISEDSYIHIFINKGWNDNFNTISHLVNPNNIKNYISNPYLLTNYEDFISINNNPNLILDEDVSKICSEDSVIITEEQYDSLSSIFKSEDAENMAIGLEVLANCNIEQSLDKASLLYFHYASKFKYAKNWNSINVKALRVRLDPVGSYEGYNRHIYPYERLFKFLKKYNSITEFAYKNAIISIFETLIDSIGLKESTVFKLKISDIKLSREFAIEQVDPNQLTFDKLLDNVPF